VQARRERETTVTNIEHYDGRDLERIERRSIDRMDELPDTVNRWAVQVYCATGQPIVGDDLRFDEPHADLQCVRFTVRAHGYRLHVELPRPAFDLAHADARSLPSA
jgi:hypothetical protein